MAIYLLVLDLGMPYFTHLPLGSFILGLCIYATRTVHDARIRLLRSLLDSAAARG